MIPRPLRLFAPVLLFAFTALAALPALAQDQGEAQLKFVNETAGDVNVFRLDNKGQEQLRGTVKPGEETAMAAVVGRTWVVRDAAGKELARHTIKADDPAPTLRITGDSAPPEDAPQNEPPQSDPPKNEPKNNPGKEPKNPRNGTKPPKNDPPKNDPTKSDPAKPDRTKPPKTDNTRPNPNKPETPKPEKGEPKDEPKGPAKDQIEGDWEKGGSGEKFTVSKTADGIRLSNKATGENRDFVAQRKGGYREKRGAGEVLVLVDKQLQLLDGQGKKVLGTFGRAKDKGDMPDPTKPDRTKPDNTKPDRTKPDPTKPDRTKPDNTKPDRTKPDKTKPDNTKPDRTKPDQSDATTNNPKKRPDAEAVSLEVSNPTRGEVKVSELDSSGKAGQKTSIPAGRSQSIKTKIGATIRIEDANGKELSTFLVEKGMRKIAAGEPLFPSTWQVAGKNDTWTLSALNNGFAIKGGGKNLPTQFTLSKPGEYAARGWTAKFEKGNKLTLQNTEGRNKESIKLRRVNETRPIDQIGKPPSDAEIASLGVKPAAAAVDPVGDWVSKDGALAYSFARKGQELQLVGQAGPLRNLKADATNVYTEMTLGGTTPQPHPENRKWVFTDTNTTQLVDGKTATEFTRTKQQPMEEGSAIAAGKLPYGLIADSSDLAIDGNWTVDLPSGPVTFEVSSTNKGLFIAAGTYAANGAHLLREKDQKNVFQRTDANPVERYVFLDADTMCICASGRVPYLAYRTGSSRSGPLTGTGGFGDVDGLKSVKLDGSWRTTIAAADLASRGIYESHNYQYVGPRPCKVADGLVLLPPPGSNSLSRNPAEGSKSISLELSGANTYSTYEHVNDGVGRYTTNLVPGGELKLVSPNVFVSHFTTRSPMFWWRDGATPEEGTGTSDIPQVAFAVAFRSTEQTTLSGTWPSGVTLTLTDSLGKSAELEISASDAFEAQYYGNQLQGAIVTAKLNAQGQGLDLPLSCLEVHSTSSVLFPFNGNLRNGETTLTRVAGVVNRLATYVELFETTSGSPVSKGMLAPGTFWVADGSSTAARNFVARTAYDPSAEQPFSKFTLPAATKPEELGMNFLTEPTIDPSIYPPLGHQTWVSTATGKSYYMQPWNGNNLGVSGEIPKVTNDPLLMVEMYPSSTRPRLYTRSDYGGSQKILEVNLERPQGAVMLVRSMDGRVEDVIRLQAPSAPGTVLRLADLSGPNRQEIKQRLLALPEPAIKFSDYYSFDNKSAVPTVTADKLQAAFEQFNERYRATASDGNQSFGTDLMLVATANAKSELSDKVEEVCDGMSDRGTADALKSVLKGLVNDRGMVLDFFDRYRNTNEDIRRAVAQDLLTANSLLSLSGTTGKSGPPSTGEMVDMAWRTALGFVSMIPGGQFAEKMEKNIGNFQAAANATGLIIEASEAIAQAVKDYNDGADSNTGNWKTDGTDGVVLAAAGLTVDLGKELTAVRGATEELAFLVAHDVDLIREVAQMNRAAAAYEAKVKSGQVTLSTEEMDYWKDKNLRLPNSFQSYDVTRRYMGNKMYKTMLPARLGQFSQTLGSEYASSDTTPWNRASLAAKYPGEAWHTVGYTRVPNQFDGLIHVYYRWNVRLIPSDMSSSETLADIPTQLKTEFVRCGLTKLDLSNAATRIFVAPSFMEYVFWAGYEKSSERCQDYHEIKQITEKTYFAVTGARANYGTGWLGENNGPIQAIGLLGKFE